MGIAGSGLSTIEPGSSIVETGGGVLGMAGSGLRICLELLLLFLLLLIQKTDAEVL